MLMVCLACDEPLPPLKVDLTRVQAVGTPLIRKGGWTVTAAESDPWAAERPAVVDCPDYAIEVEPGGLEIDTGDCNYATIEQPIRDEIRPGDEIALIFWHNVLVAATEGTAHVALQFGDEMVWEITLPIPSPGRVHTPTLRAETLVPAGTLAYLHLHNHGANTWLFSTLEVRRAIAQVSGE